MEPDGINIRKSGIRESRVLLAVALCLLLAVPSPGHARKKKEEVPGSKVEFLPIAKNEKFSPRSSIEFSKRTEADLLAAGFAKIGLVEATIVKRSCTSGTGKEICEDLSWKGDVKAELLSRAARSGGDLAVMLKDGEKTRKFSEGEKCVSWQSNYGYRYVQNYATGLSDLVWGPMGQTCRQFESFRNAYDLEISVAQVWRHDPGLADRIRMAENFVTAAGDGDMAAVKKALDAGIDINRTTSSEGSLALSRAALMGQRQMVQYLIDRGAKVNAYDRIASPLYQAVFGGHLDVVKLLLDEGAKINHKNPTTKRTVMFAAARGGSKAIIDELIRRKGKVKVTDPDGITPLMVAAGSGKTAAVRALIAAGAKVDLRMKTVTQVAAKWTALHFAAFQGHPDTVLALLEGGAKPDIKGYYGYKPLDLALLMAGMTGTADNGEKGRFQRTVNLLYGFEKGLYGFIDDRGRMVIPVRFLEAAEFSEGLAPVAIGGPDEKKYGYINDTGNFVIQPRYDEASPFSEGFGRVGVEKKWKGGGPYVHTRHGFIDRRGKFLVRPGEVVGAYSFSEGLAPVEVCGKEGCKWGYMDRTGAMVVKPVFQSATRFSGGLALVGNRERALDDTLYGFIDKKGGYVVKPQFQYTNFLMGAAQPFTEGLSAAHLAGKWGFINTAGETVIEPRFTEAFSFHEGLAAALDKKWGFVDKSGNWVISPQFYWPGLHGGFSEGLCTIEFKKGHWGYIDKSGKTVINPVYEAATSFKDGKAAVREKGKWGIIDKSGRFLVQPAFSWIGKFGNGLAPVKVAGPAFLKRADSILTELEKK